MDNKNEFVPITKIPDDDRIKRLTLHYEREYNSKPAFYVRVPGRVNLIGEHIDYCGYPVLPMALTQNILMAVGTIPQHKLSVTNVNSKYTSLEYDLKSYEDVAIKPNEDGKPYWYNYVLCGVKGAMEYLNDDYKNGVQIVVDGNIPPASGLSSSSALVSAACLSFLQAQGRTITKSNIASLCASSERYIGTQGGGMDQAIAFLAEENCAQYITWKPLTATSVVLPENVSFVVAHSLAEANKAATNDFNRRVIECRLAARILAKLESDSFDDKLLTLSEVQNMLGRSLEKMADLVEKHLPNHIYTKDNICEILDMNKEHLEELYMTPNTKHIEEFKLRQRALHVYNEAMRVEKFREACTRQTNGNVNQNGLNGYVQENGKSESNIEILGQLMLASHESLKNLYECSHENLDLLVEVSKGLNVYSRLTGAGWGGCIVAVCPSTEVDRYIKAIKKEFYEGHCKVSNEDADSLIFATTPNHGAVIYM